MRGRPGVRCQAASPHSTLQLGPLLALFLTGCAFARPAGEPMGIHFMLDKGVVVRIDVTGPEFGASSGARIGDTELEVRRLLDGVFIPPRSQREAPQACARAALDAPGFGVVAVAANERGPGVDSWYFERAL